jgi:SAM-dependent methyltransferase
VVLDIGAGYCEFINRIRAGKKYALDLNPATREKAGRDVEVSLQDVAEPWPLASDSVDLAFSSNFFEHLPSKMALQACLEEAFRVLRSGGLLLAMGPNIRFCGQIYWDFFDHYLPLSDRSLLEVLEMVGFQGIRTIARFMPFTAKGRLPVLPILVRMYLAFPPAWLLLGKQFLIVARKP